MKTITNNRASFSRSANVDLNLRFSDPKLKHVVESLSAHLMLGLPPTTRAETRRQVACAMHGIIASLIRAHWAGLDYVGISLARGHYVNNTRHKVGYKAIRLTIELLKNRPQSDQEKIPPLIKIFPGFMSKDGYKERTKFTLNPDLESITQYNAEYEFRDCTISMYKELINIINEVKDINIIPITSTITKLFAFEYSAYPLRLKDEEGRIIGFERSSEVDRMAEHVRQYNDLINQFRVKIDLPGYDVDSLLKETESKLTERGEGWRSISHQISALGLAEDRTVSNVQSGLF